MPTPRTVRIALALPATISIACADAAAPLRVRGVRAVRIEPSAFALSVGASVQLQAVVDADPGVDTAVRWSSAPSPSGGVSPTGLLTSCYPPGVLRVTATSVADSTRAATLEVPVTAPAVGWVVPWGFVRPGAPLPPGPGAIVSRDSIAGDVELALSLSPQGILACRAIERVELRLRASGVDTIAVSLAFEPPFREGRNVRLPLRSGTLQPGAYDVSALLRITGLPTPLEYQLGSIAVRRP